MPFIPKDWRNSPETSTPISAAALEDMEGRVTDYAEIYADAFLGGMGDTSVIAEAELTDNASATDTSIDVSGTEPSGFVIIEPYGTDAEVREISSLAGSTVNLTTALANNHTTGDRVIFFKGALNLRDLRTSATDWGDIINDALTAGVRHFLFPPGAYPFATQIDLAGYWGVKFEGVGGSVDHYGNVLGTIKRAPAYLLWEGTGTTSPIKFATSVGCEIHSLGVYYSSGSFTGRLIDWRTNAAVALLSRCDIGSFDDAHQSALANVHMNDSWNNAIRDCNIRGAQWNILGDDAGNSFCDTLRITGCNFSDASIAHIGGIGRQWDIDGNFFGMGAEGVGEVTPAVIDSPASIAVDLKSYFNFTNNSCWDDTAGADEWFVSSAVNYWYAVFSGNVVLRSEGPLFSIQGGGVISIINNPHLGDHSDGSAVVDLGDVTGSAIEKNLNFEGNRWIGDSGSDGIINRAGHFYLNIESYIPETYTRTLRTLGGQERLAWPTVGEDHPGVAAEAALGSGASAGIIGTDLAGFVYLTPGSGATSGKQATITLAEAMVTYPDSPGSVGHLHVMITPIYLSAGGYTGGPASVPSVEVTVDNKTSWAIRTNNALAASGLYAYRILGL